MVESHLFINKNTGLSVFLGCVSINHSLPLCNVVAMCDCCGGDVYQEERQTNVGILTRYICSCSCRVFLDLFTDVKSNRLLSFLDVVGVVHE